jgi:hypothetical protein
MYLIFLFLSICSGLFFDKTEANGDLMIKRNLMHTDSWVLKICFKISADQGLYQRAYSFTGRTRHILA